MRSSNVKKRRAHSDSARRVEVGVPGAPKKVVAAPLARLGWSRTKAAEVRASLRAFDEDWNAPGMEAYDRL